MDGGREPRCANEPDSWNGLEASDLGILASMAAQESQRLALRGSRRIGQGVELSNRLACCRALYLRYNGSTSARTVHRLATHDDTMGTQTGFDFELQTPLLGHHVVVVLHDMLPDFLTTKLSRSCVEGPQWRVVRRRMVFHNDWLGQPVSDELDNTIMFLDSPTLNYKLRSSPFGTMWRSGDRAMVVRL